MASTPNLPKPTDDGDDTEGHARHMVKATEGEDDDTEGQVLLPNPEISRQLARDREEEIQRNLKRHALAVEARRPKGNRSASTSS